MVYHKKVLIFLKKKIYQKIACASSRNDIKINYTYQYFSIVIFQFNLSPNQIVNAPSKSHRQCALGGVGNCSCTLPHWCTHSGSRPGRQDILRRQTSIVMSCLSIRPSGSPRTKGTLSPWRRPAEWTFVPRPVHGMPLVCANTNSQGMEHEQDDTRYRA